MQTDRAAWVKYYSTVVTGLLAFFPKADVPRTLRRLKPLLPVDMAKATAHYKVIWIRTSTSNPIFTHDIWSHHDSTQLLIPHSTNIPEGWHHGFNSLLSCSKPTIGKFLNCLKSENSLRGCSQLISSICGGRFQKRGTEGAWLNMTSKAMWNFKNDNKKRGHNLLL